MIEIFAFGNLLASLLMLIFFVVESVKGGL
jgi:hypothetical protein